MDLLLSVNRDLDLRRSDLKAVLGLKQDVIEVFPQVHVVHVQIEEEDFYEVETNAYVEGVDLNSAVQLQNPRVPTPTAPMGATTTQGSTGSKLMESSGSSTRIGRSSTTVTPSSSGDPSLPPVCDYYQMNWGLQTILKEPTVSPPPKKSGLDLIPLKKSPKPEDPRTSPVDVFVLDTGIYAGHDCFRIHPSRPDSMVQTFWVARPGESALDHEGHGTHVASLVMQAANFPSDRRHLLRLHGYKVLADHGLGSKRDIIAGMDAVLEAMHQPDGRRVGGVVNMSLVGPYSEALDSSVRYMTESGLLVVCAAGNGSRDARDISPAHLEEVCTVGASTQTNQRAPFSNFGPTVDIFAPGMLLYGASCKASSHNTRKSGSSMATGLVSGAAASLFSMHPKAYPWQVAHVIHSNSVQDVLKQVRHAANRLLYANVLYFEKPDLPKLRSGNFGAASREDPDYGFAESQIYTMGSGVYEKLDRLEQKANLRFSFKLNQSGERQGEGGGAISPLSCESLSLKGSSSPDEESLLRMSFRSALKDLEPLSSSTPPTFPALLSRSRNADQGTQSSNMAQASMKRPLVPLLAARRNSLQSPRAANTPRVVPLSIRQDSFQSPRLNNHLKHFSEGFLPSGQKLNLHQFSIHTPGLAQINFFGPEHTMYEFYLERQNAQGTWERVDGSEMGANDLQMHVELRDIGPYRACAQGRPGGSYSFELQFIEGLEEEE